MFSLPEANKLIKAISFIFLFVISMLILSHCKKDNPTPRSYPRLRNTVVSDITERGASFTADLYSTGTEKIIEHGFLWGTTDPNIHYSDRIQLGPCDTPGIYSAYISSTLKKDMKYIVKPYVQTADHVVYGITMDFKSLGSSAPVIYDFYPHSAEWLDTITIKGKNFASVLSENIAKLNQTLCETISSTDTTLRVVVNSELTDLKSVISVELAGNIASLTTDTFRLIPPLLTDFNPKLASWGDTLIVSGRGLKSLTLKSSNYIKLGTVLCSILKVNDNSVSVRIPYEITSINSNLSVSINGFNFQGSQPFQLTAAEFSLNPKEGTWNDIITLTGKFNIIASRNSVSFSGVKGTIKSSSANEIKVQVPSTLSIVKTNIIYSAVPFTIISADTFRLKEPVLKTFAPFFGPGGTVVTLKGKYFSVGSSTVLFGNSPGVITSMNDSTIYVKVPTGIIGPVKISVKAKLQTIISSEDFNITNPHISSVYPLSGTFNDEVTITGENLIPATGSTTVSFSGIQATVKSSTATSIVVTVPLTMDSIPRAVTVTAGSNATSSSDKFTLNPPQITSISPAVILLGQDITITGINLNPLASGNQVMWGPNYLMVKSSSASEIIATATNVLRGSNLISIKVGGFKRQNPFLLEIRSSWSEISLPSLFTWKAGRGLNENGISFSVLGSGYLMDFTNAGMTSFNPLTYEFKDLGANQIFKGRSGFTNTIIQDTAYLIGGSMGLFRYDVSINNWVSIGVAPTNMMNGVAFSINRKIYFGLTYNTFTYILNKAFWVYDLSNRSWIPLGNFPGFSPQHSTAFFTLNNKGYVLFADKKFCRYDPETDTWTQLSSLPVSDYTRFGSISFIIDNKMYVGTGYYDGSVRDDFWIYDSVTDSWTQSIIRMPGGGRFNSMSFKANNKVYIGFGYYPDMQKRDFYEYDPDYSLK